MRRFRFHLGTLVILVLVLGVGFAALRESNKIWDSITFGITLGVRLTSIVLAIHRTESRRAFWVGFALFGWSYLGLSLVSSIEFRLITTKAIAFVDSKLPRSNPAGFAYADFDNDGNLDLYVVNNSQPNVLYPKVVLNSAGLSLTGSIGTTDNFVRIGHSLLALIAALMGGYLSRHFYAKNREPASGSVNPQNLPSNDS
jgi:hypothetical protein